MSSSQRAFQQLDPLGALVGRPLTYLAAVGIPLYAGVMTWFNRADVDSWFLAIAALVFVVASGCALAYASSPLRAPFSPRLHGVVSGSALVGYLLNALSMWDSNHYVRDDWGPIVVGLVLLALSQYRPPKEIATEGLVISLFAGVLALLQSHSLVTGVAPIVYALVTMLPILALSLASASFGKFLIDGLERWRRRARRAVSDFTSQNTNWIARSVQQDRVTILNQDVVPFFAEVLRKDSIDADDRARALRISHSIRAVMVAEVDRTWLDIIAEQSTNGAATVRDELRLAALMTTDQRTAIRAMIVALSGHPSFVASGLAISIHSESRRCRVELRAMLQAGENVIKGDFAPYFAVLRIVFSDLKVELSGATLTLRFSYDQR